MIEYLMNTEDKEPHYLYFSPSQWYQNNLQEEEKAQN